MPERRIHRRNRMVLPIKVSIGDTAQVLAHTIDITCKGARIAGLRQVLEIGSKIKLLRGSHKGNFRVVWVKQMGVDQIQAGIEALDASDTFWGVDLDHQDKEKQQDMDALLELLKGSKTARAMATRKVAK
jgi:hypothetical protein